MRYQELYAAIDTVLGKETLQYSLESERPERAFNQEPKGSAAFQAPATKSVDEGVLEGLIGKDPAMILDFLNAFRIGAAKIALELKADCDAGQAILASRQAHKLRSSAHLVGALALGKLCSEMEAAGQAGSTETLIKLLPLFERELDAVNAFVDAFQPTDADRP